MPDVGLIETVRIRHGAAPLWPLHRSRLERSAALLGIPLPDDLSAPAGGADRVVRLLADHRGLTSVDRPVGPTSPLALVTSEEMHPGYPLKTTLREPFDRATAAARSTGADDGVLLAGAGRLAEAGRWTLFWWDGDRLAGPPLALGILDSVSRARIRELVGEVTERDVTPAELRDVSILAANAARGVVSVATLDGHRVPQSPRTSALAARFWP